MFSYTEVERSTSVGASVNGGAWQRSGDTVGIALRTRTSSLSHCLGLMATMAS